MKTHEKSYLQQLLKLRKYVYNHYVAMQYKMVGRNADDKVKCVSLCRMLGHNIKKAL
jgi:hypothetical protein